MTDQLWENEETVLSKKLIGKISNMKEFWTTVSDDDSIRKNVTTAHDSGKSLPEKELLKKSTQNRTEKYVNFIEAKNSGEWYLEHDILDSNDAEHKRKCEKGKTKAQLSFWEGILEEKYGDSKEPVQYYPGKIYQYRFNKNGSK